MTVMFGEQPTEVKYKKLLNVRCSLHIYRTVFLTFYRHLLHVESRRRRRVNWILSKIHKVKKGTDCPDNLKRC